LKNRIVYTPMVSCLSTETGEVTTEYVEFIGQQARTGASLITIGATCVNHDHGVDVPGELSVVRDENVAGLSRLAAEAHRYGAKLSVELCHGGRASYPPLLRVPYAIAPSNFPAPLGTPYIKEMDQYDMDGVIRDYVDCALRCKTAGFDMIMIHAAHGNLIAQFLSSYSNHRTDCYGGSLENRMRFPLALIMAVREAVGPKFGIDMRVSGDEIVPGGQKMDEVLEFLKLSQEYIDTVQISQGLIIDPDYMFIRSRPIIITIVTISGYPNRRKRYWIFPSPRSGLSTVSRMRRISLPRVRLILSVWRGSFSAILTRSRMLFRTKRRRRGLVCVALRVAQNLRA
jgi:2,4-dienoyl-CoA reductase-like NADH-dependent reductase (Old Yellow Enzyme family)